MKRFQQFGVTVWCGLMVLALAAPVRADWGSERKAVQEMIARTAALEKTDPEKAALAYRTFYQQSQGMDPTHMVQVLSRMIRLHHDPLKQTEIALQLCDWALERFEEHPARLVVISDKARILTEEKRAEEAVALMEKEWDSLAFARPEQNGPLLAQYCRTMDQTGKGAEATATLRKLVASNAMLLVDWYQEGGSAGWIYNRIVGDFIARKEFDEALRWAKLRFVTTTPEKTLPGAAEEVLRGVWRARDRGDRTWNAFEESQADPGKPNPLAEVKLPEVDAEAMRKQAAEIHWGLGVARAAALVTVGDLGDAMLLARGTMENHNVNSGCAMAITVLHAADLHMRRVEALQQARRAGKGHAPIIEEFLKQHPPKGEQ